MYDSGMSTQALQCPHCGAPLTIQPGESLVSCTYCGSKILVSSNAAPAIHTPGASYMLDVRRMVEEGQVEEAIQLFQQSTGASLDAATRVVAVIAERLNMPTGIRNAASLNPQAAQVVRRASGLGCLGIVLVIVVFAAGILGLINLIFRSSDSFNAAVKLMNQSTQVQQALGSPVTPGVLIFGSLNSSGNFSRYNYNFTVYGPRRSAQVNVSGASDPSGVHMDVWLTYTSGSEDTTIHLREGR